MNIRKINDEVFYTTDELTTVNIHDIEFLKDKAIKNPRKRSRLCTHLESKDSLHEMLIFLGKNSYIRPHKHINKSESFHIIEGRISVVLFDDEGHITGTVDMGDYSSGKAFYYKLAGDGFHTVVVLSEHAIFHETTNGPFNYADTIYASWAPEENNDDGRKIYMDYVAKFLGIENIYIEKK